MENMNSFMSNKQKHKQKTTAEDQHRKVMALYNIASNDYDQARLRCLLYKNFPGAVQEVVELHEHNVADKTTCRESAKRELNQLEKAKDKVS